VYEAFRNAFVTYFVTVDPLGLAPIFLALTAPLAPGLRRRLAARAVLVGSALLFLFALFGDGILEVLGISLAGFRIGGGVFLFVLALEMVFERRGERRGSRADLLAREQSASELAVFPLGVPLIAGPAAITAAILTKSRVAGDPADFLAALVALALVLLLTWLVFRLAERLERWLRPTLIAVLSRLFGLLLGALAAQYVIDGILEVLPGVRAG